MATSASVFDCSKTIESLGAMNKLLFIVNGLGLGNSSRCDSIIQALIPLGFEVDVLTSNNGVYYFRNRDYVSNLYQFRSLYYGSSEGKLSVWRTIGSVPDFLRILISNVGYLKNLVRKNDYRAFVIDSDYSIMFLRKSLRKPIIALNNADVVIEECKKLPRLPKSIWMQYLIEHCDNLYHRIVPDIVLSPSILPKESKRESLRHFPPFVRQGLEIREPCHEVRNILVMLSGTIFGANTEFLNRMSFRTGMRVDVVGRDGESTSCITYHGKIYANEDIINNADLMVVNGGFSAVSEAIVLRKPVVVIPVENHAEQFINGRIVEDSGLGLVATMENIDVMIQKMIENYGEFVDAHERFNCPRGGAEGAGRAIAGFIGT